MKKNASWTALVAVILAAGAAFAAPEWPAPSAETKPWTINWWPASAVDEKGLTAQMDALAEAGFGGMRVIPIYEVKGYETNGVEMLTDEWYRRYKLGYDLAKARGLEMDLSMGAGWCFGGKWIPKRLGVHALVGVTNGQPVVEFKQIGVKRTSKADWGWMLNPFSMEAMELHLKQFERFGKDGIPCPRAFCHDSFEYFFASWSDDMKTVPDTPEKLYLYRREISEREVAVFSRWADWCRQRGIRTCNQAHGSPGDLISLYALADIPETEMFGDAPDYWVSKFASSAAHLKGTRQVGAETFTWLDEHFRETPEKMKRAFDLLALAGINQIYLEGTCYSAAEAPWPGWLFYAASQMNPRNPLWDHLKAFWTYVERIQNLSQSSESDADLLIYHSFENWWKKPREGKNKSYAQQMTVHDTSWLTSYPILRHINWHGIHSDFVSEGTLHFLEERKHHYKAILIPPDHYVSPAAMKKMEEIAAKQGLKIIHPASLREQLCAKDLAAFAAAGIRREGFADHRNGKYARFRRGKDTLYFVYNDDKRPLKGPFKVCAPMKAAWSLDPMTGAIDPIEVTAKNEVVCDIPPKATRWIWTSPEGAGAGEVKVKGEGEGVLLTSPVQGPWTLTPVKGGPDPLPAPRKMTTLSSWSTRADGTDEPFCGTMRYETTFDLPEQMSATSAVHPGPSPSPVTLSLGEVKWTARVVLNGRELATLIAPPYEVTVPAGLLRAKGNTLVVDVSNLGRNRIRDLDRRGIEWRQFYIVGRDYKTFNLKGAPNEPSGLLGPVTISGLPEAPYAFRARLERVHEPNRRDASLKPAADEFAFTDGCAVADADFADYLRVSMNVNAIVSNASQKDGLSDSRRDGDHRVHVKIDPSLSPRECVIDVTKSGVKIRAYDDRALRQAYCHLEDLMNLRGAPFLKIGTERRRMRFSPRMIHSGYACDVFPDNYLKLVAHHGFDAIVFYIKDIDKTAAGPDQHVNDLIARAKREGLDTYLYSSVSCFAHPDDPKGRAEIEASFGRIAKAHPGAKGIVFVGESCQFPSKDPRVQPVRHQDKNNADPRPLAGWFPCRDYPDWLKAVMDVLHQYSPQMEIVFWTYNWSSQDEKACADLIPHFPDGVAIQGTLGNDAVTKHDNGLVCICRDYTVSTPGFTPHYTAEAKAAKAAGRRFYTMANTAGLTWDYGTAPYLPCPFQWKKRWDGLVDPQYGIAGLMETHHFGWYPSFISELAKEAYTEGGMPFDEHIRKIAARDYGAANADKVVEAWRKWSRTEVDYVANNENQYGPFRIGPAFPYNFGGKKIAHAEFPQDKRAYHTMRWMAILNFPFDLEQAHEQNIAFTELDDAYRLKQLELLERMRADWSDGVKLLRGALGDCARPAAGADHRAARCREMIRVGEWHQRTVETAINLNRGYLAFKRGDKAEVLKYARAEYANARAALRLAETDSRLGWEPSMEYAAGPEQIRWKLARMEALYGAANLK